MARIEPVSVNTPDPEECRRVARQDRAYWDDLYERDDDYDDRD